MEMSAEIGTAQHGLQERQIMTDTFQEDGTAQHGMETTAINGQVSRQ